MLLNKRVQKHNKNLQKCGADIERFLNLAYQTILVDVCYQLETGAFIDRLQDKESSWCVKFSECFTFLVR